MVLLQPVWKVIIMEQAPTRIDPRKVRTRHMLRDALIALILRKGYDAITIQDITDEAGLRRATFYLHYRDKEDLLFAMLREVFDTLKARFDETRLPILTHEAEMQAHLIVFQHASENADLYRTILEGRGSTIIVRYIRDYVATIIRANVLNSTQDKPPVIPIEVLATYLAAVKLNMVTWWLEAGMPYTVEEMAAMCTRLTMEGVPPLPTR